MTTEELVKQLTMLMAEKPETREWKVLAEDYPDAGSDAFAFPINSVTTSFGNKKITLKW